MMRILIKNGRVIDPGNGRDGVCDILIEDSLISKLGRNIKADGASVIDAGGKIVMPGAFDMHVHLRQPGREDKETVASGTLAALSGGITGVLAMPNTDPAMDSRQNIGLLKEAIAKDARVDVFIAGAITKGRRGQELTDIKQLKEAGIIAVSDDGASVDSDVLMLEALKQAKKEKILLIAHCEDRTLSNHGAVNLGRISTLMGLRGISDESEYLRVKRDIDLAGKIDAPIHIAHVSCKESVEIIAKAKKKGIPVTCETAAHYFALEESAVLEYDTNFKMNPPLRGKDDVLAIKQGLSDGTIDAIASDHAPHTENEKEIEFERAEFGVIGLETLLSVSITELVCPGILSWSELVKKIAFNPAQILRVKKGTFTEGAVADVVVVSADKEWVVEKERMRSQSKNSPFLGKSLKGVIESVIYNGKII
jgi:dihydroorotase